MQMAPYERTAAGQRGEVLLWFFSAACVATSARRCSKLPSRMNVKAATSFFLASCKDVPIYLGLTIVSCFLLAYIVAISVNKVTSSYLKNIYTCTCCFNFTFKSAQCNMQVTPKVFFLWKKLGSGYFCIQMTGFSVQILLSLAGLIALG